MHNQTIEFRSYTDLAGKPAFGLHTRGKIHHRLFHVAARTGLANPGRIDINMARGAGAGTVVTDWLNYASLVTVWPFGPVVVTVRVPFPPTTVVSTVRSIVLPLAVVMTSLLFQEPGATFVSVEV